MKKELCDRITQYISVGGSFNPELMEHDKVRDLLMECREEMSLTTTETVAQDILLNHNEVMEEHPESNIDIETFVAEYMRDMVSDVTWYLEKMLDKKE